MLPLQKLERLSYQTLKTALSYLHSSGLRSFRNVTDIKNTPKCISGRALPQTLLGELTRLPRLPSRMSRGIPPPPHTLPHSVLFAPRFSRLWRLNFLRYCPPPIFSSRTALVKLLRYTVKHLLLNQSATFSITAAKRSTSHISLDSHLPVPPFLHEQ